MALTQDMVLEKLKNVIDPELFVNIVDLGLIYEIQLKPPGAEADATSAPQETASAPQATASAPQETASAPQETADSSSAAPERAETPSAAPAHATEVPAQATDVPVTPDETDDSAASACDNNTGTKVHIDMTMTSPACPAGPQLIGGAKKEVSSLEGVTEVEVRIVLDPPWTPDRMTEDAKDTLGIF